jgi:hypothetical protein
MLFNRLNSRQLNQQTDSKSTLPSNSIFFYHLFLSPESVTPERRSAQTIDSSLLPQNWGEPMGAPAIFEKQIEIKLLHSASTEGVTDSGFCKDSFSSV